MPIMMEKGSRAFSGKVASEIAAQGYCTTKNYEVFKNGLIPLLSNAKCYLDSAFPIAIGLIKLINLMT